jgi:hypothetical protein
MDKLNEFMMALREFTGLSGARQRERYLMSRMEWLLEQDRPTFENCIVASGLKRGTTRYLMALKIYDEQQ